MTLFPKGGREDGGVATTLSEEVTVGGGSCHHNTPLQGVRDITPPKGTQDEGGAHHSFGGGQKDEVGVSSQPNGVRGMREGCRHNRPPKGVPCMTEASWTRTLRCWPDSSSPKCP